MPLLRSKQQSLPQQQQLLLLLLQPQQHQFLLPMNLDESCPRPRALSPSVVIHK